jgi:hypothetical protein
MRTIHLVLLISLVALGIGILIGFWIGEQRSAIRVDRVVAMSWGDGKFGKAFYGAHVFLEPRAGGYSVGARVYIGRSNNYFDDCGELGRVSTDTEAVGRWGRIEWHDDGLHIGNGTNQFFLPRAQFERHR